MRPDWHILIVEDDPAQRRLLELALACRGRMPFVHVAGNLADFIAAIDGREFDCVVMDYQLSDCTAVEMLTELRRRHPNCPTIVVSASVDQRIAVVSFRNGGNDFLSKQEALRPGILLHRVRSVIHSSRRLARDRRHYQRRIRRYSARSEVDPLTGLHNRRYVETALHSGRRNQRDRRDGLSLFMIDLDHFKQINDEYGHQAGDGVLKLVADQIKVSLMPGDVACRYGGEEFVVIRPNCPLANAVAWAECLRKRIERLNGSNHSLRGPVTVSIGVTTCLASQFDEPQFGEADAALYLAKSTGRNRVRTWQMAHWTAVFKTLYPVPATPEEKLTRLIQTTGSSLGQTQRHDLAVHGRDVASLSRAIAESMGLSRLLTDSVRRAGLLHDLGKIIIPEPVLGKQQELTDAEWRLISRYADEGADLARQLGADAVTSEMIRLHHRSFNSLSDQKGDVSLGASITAVSDTFCAITSDRPYRPAQSRTAALRVLLHGKSWRFDPCAVVAARNVITDRAYHSMMPPERRRHDTWDAAST